MDRREFLRNSVYAAAGVAVFGRLADLGVANDFHYFAAGDEVPLWVLRCEREGAPFRADITFGCDVTVVHDGERAHVFTRGAVPESHSMVVVDGHGVNGLHLIGGPTTYHNAPYSAASLKMRADDFVLAD